MGATAFEKIMVSVKVPYIIGLTLVAAIKSLFTGTNGAPTFGEYIINAGVRAMFGTMSIDQLQWLLPSSVDTYQSWCTDKKLTPDLCKIKAPTGDVDAFWIGNKSTAKYHMVYFHGGGWVMPASPGHIDMLTKFVAWSNNKLAILCVAYTRLPEAPYPIAIGQCVEGLRYLLDEQKCSPSKVLLGGDSAGGNMALAVLSHISHPHPQKDLVKPLQLSQPLFGTLLISPWISDDIQKYRSFQTFAERDSFPLVTVEYWGKCYKGEDATLPADEYMWPTIADASWWKGIPCKNMIASVGENEGTLDSTTDWAQKYRQGAGAAKLELAVGAQETHIYPILSPLPDQKLREKENSTAEGAIMKWIRSKLV